MTTVGFAAPPALATGSSISTDNEVDALGKKITVTYETDQPAPSPWRTTQ
ncbi:hypothetical protein SAMN06309944_2328 [Micrococcales bacterium KH10]|nr:hypothetical protein SAMN06309944_2328 [Micrococcales bacterium KH10]